MTGPLPRVVDPAYTPLPTSTRRVMFGFGPHAADSSVQAPPAPRGRSSGQSMVTVVHGVACTSVASTLSTHRIITVAPENGARSAALKAAEA